MLASNALTKAVEAITNLNIWMTNLLKILSICAGAYEHHEVVVQKLLICEIIAIHD